MPLATQRSSDPVLGHRPNRARGFLANVGRLAAGQTLRNEFTSNGSSWRPAA